MKTSMVSEMEIQNPTSSRMAENCSSVLKDLAQAEAERMSSQRRPPISPDIRCRILLSVRFHTTREMVTLRPNRKGEEEGEATDKSG